MPVYSILLLAFFACAFFLLLVIVAMRLPAMFSALKKSIRLIAARRHREIRFAPDPKKMEAAAHEVEDVYRFNED